ncbi:transposase family protein [Vibrio cholerae]|nr:transposase family protein [Vibrio cholerae]
MITRLTNPFMHFELIKDYRQTAKVEHKLSDIIILIICGVLSAYDTWEGVNDLGVTRLGFLKAIGEFENSVPPPDTIAQVMGMGVKYLGNVLVLV